MSRIGKLPIIIPNNVKIDYSDSEINVNGEFGSLQIKIPPTIQINIKHDTSILNVTLNDKSKKLRALHGLYRTLINNMIIGVSEQFEINLVLKGVGYRAAIQGEEIILNLGYSHPVKLKIPNDISIKVVQNTNINLKSCNKEKLGLFASTIRAWRKPEPYKGKGILYQNEQIRRKAGKAGK